MSVEQHGKSTHDTDQFQIPDTLHHEERVDDLGTDRDGNWLLNHWKQITAVGTAGIALAAGLAFGLKDNGGGSAKEGQRPVATASANPGEASPSATANETDPTTWTADNLPVSVDVDGNGSAESFTGKEQLAKALSLEVAKYPTPEAAAKALLERFNTVVSFGTNEADAAKYDKFASADRERVGVGAVKQDVVLPAFMEALVADPADGAAVMADTSSWAEWVNSTAQEVNHRWIITKDQTPYKYSCETDTAKTAGGVVFNSGDEATHLKHGTVFIKCTDNLDQTDLGSRQMADGTQGYNSLASHQSWFVDLQQQGDKWKLVGMQTEQSLQ